jgi:hypothetical protein
MEHFRGDLQNHWQVAAKQGDNRQKSSYSVVPGDVSQHYHRFLVDFMIQE